MMNRLARYAMGSVNFEVTGGRGERFLNDCVNAGVPVEHIRPTQTGYLATVPLRDYKRMHKYARRNRCRLRRFWWKSIRHKIPRNLRLYFCRGFF